MNLENNGERVDIDYNNIDYDKFDIYQKSHFNRYDLVKSFIKPEDVVADMACGTGYGSMLLSEVAKEVHSFDIDEKTINELKGRYKTNKVFFNQMNLLNIYKPNFFDTIISFETIEHFSMDDLKNLIKMFYFSLKHNGNLIFSVPYNQKECNASKKFHKIFNLTEDSIIDLFKYFFQIDKFLYQNYKDHVIYEKLHKKDFLICIATKKEKINSAVSFNVNSLYEGHNKTTYRGISCLKCPLDYVIYQMILNEVKPDIVVEIGTNNGGSALYLSDILEKIGNGVVHTIDIKDKVVDPVIINSKTIMRFKNGYQNYPTALLENKKVLIIDDGSHVYKDVLESLNKFSQYVSKDSYFIVEDGIINELGLESQYNGGPLRAIDEFLKFNSNFIIDKKWNNLYGQNASFNVCGYLRKV